MSKTDNLTDFLTDVADAIRAKKGISGTINPQDFSTEISTIESGGSKFKHVKTNPTLNKLTGATQYKS